MRQRRDDHLPVLPWALAGRGRTVLRYSLVSLVSVAVSQSALVVAFGLLHWTARPANVAACAVATVPSYYLNRGWTWGRRGRSRVWKEVVPFWALAFLGLAFSTWAADLGQTLARAAGGEAKIESWCRARLLADPTPEDTRPGRPKPKDQPAPAVPADPGPGQGQGGPSATRSPSR